MVHKPNRARRLGAIVPLVAIALVAMMGMLALAEQLNNVSAACRRAGISRSHYYEIKEAFEKFGAEGLAPQTRRKPRMPNQTPPEVETQILEMTDIPPTAICASPIN